MTGSAGTAVYSGIRMLSFTFSLSPGHLQGFISSDGIMQAAETAASAQKEDLSDSLRDLEALMSKAKQMVDMARSLNEKLAAQERQIIGESDAASSSSSTLPEEAVFVKNSMARLGLTSAAVTPDMVKDDLAYHEELAKELAGVLIGSPASSSTVRPSTRDGARPREGLIQMHKGLIGLDEAWCGWNRARGVGTIDHSCGDGSVSN